MLCLSEFGHCLFVLKTRREQRNTPFAARFNCFRSVTSSINRAVTRFCSCALTQQEPIPQHSELAFSGSSVELPSAQSSRTTHQTF